MVVHEDYYWVRLRLIDYYFSSLLLSVQLVLITKKANQHARQFSLVMRVLLLCVVLSCRHVQRTFRVS